MCRKITYINGVCRKIEFYLSKQKIKIMKKKYPYKEQIYIHRSVEKEWHTWHSFLFFYKHIILSGLGIHHSPFTIHHYHD